MSKMWNREPQTVRPRRRSGHPLLLCVLMFVLTAVAVYRWGYQNWTPVSTKSTYTATVNVIEQSDEAATGKTRVPITFTDADSKRAAEMADTLAERYASDRCAEWQRRMEGPCLKAKQVVAEANQAYRESVAQFEAFERQLLEAAENAARKKAAPKPPKMADNPRWLDVQHELAELQQQRAKLLIDRTPLHPAVREVEVHIAESEEKLAAIPRQIVDRQAPATADHHAEVQAAEQNQAKLRELAAEVEKNRQTWKNAELTENQVLGAWQTKPQFSMEPARIVQNPPQVDSGWRRLIWTTLMASVMMSFGIGSVSLGSGIEPPVASVAEVQTSLGVPVVGVIPDDNPALNPDAVNRQSRVRRATIAIGLFLMVASPMVAIWGVMRIPF